jgi:hypothetical protein
MKRGQRLTYEGKTIQRKDLVTDGPFGESKEVIGCYWFIVANSLEEAAQIGKRQSLPRLRHLCGNQAHRPGTRYA